MSHGGGGPRGPGAPRGGPGGPGGGRGAPGGRGGGGGGRGGGEAMSAALGLQQMEASLKGLTLADPKATKWSVNVYKQMGVQRRLRPNQGTLGRPSNILANHFPMKLAADAAYHYDVAFRSLPGEGQKVPPRLKRREGQAPPPFPAGLGRRLLVQLAAQHKWPAGWASDGRKNLYTATSFLPREPTEYVVKLQAEAGLGKERIIAVTIKYAATVDLAQLKAFVQGTLGADPPREALQVLDVVLRHGVSMRENAYIIGANVFFNMHGDPNMWMDLGRGLEAWAGYKQSVKPCQYGLSLNIDLAATAFVMGHTKLPDLVASMLGKRDASQLRPPLSPRDQRMIRDGLRGLRVILERGDRVFRKTIRAVGHKDCANIKFFNEQENREMDLVEYNKKAYGLTLKYPFLPPVNVSTDPAWPVWQPMEICTSLPGQRRRFLDDPKVTTAMLKFAGLKPNERRPYLESVVTELGGFNQDPTVKAFGIEVSSKMKEVQARVIKQPMLTYSHPPCLDPGPKGAWSLEGKKFADPKVIQSWAFVNFCRQADVDIEGSTSLQAFLKDLVWKLSDTGMGQVAMPTIIHARQGQSVLDLMKEAAAAAQKQFGQKAQLIVAMLPVAKTDSRYKEVKVASDSFLGIPSQCFAAPKASVGQGAQFKDRAQYCANLCMKINAKLGGVNNKLTGEARVVPVIGNRPFIVMGADVTHPTSFNETEPSIAAVVGSYDSTMVRYASRVMQQGHRQEIIAGLKEAAKDLMRVFHTKTRGRKPEAILFYRDGVSEGQFQEVLDYEYKALREACEELEAGYCPPITFVIVQKRHGTRLFPTNPRDEEKFNVMPGTVVDREICHPTQFDFILNSHAGLQGHNKSAHYHVLVDENGFSADGLQLLTYWMCYLYCRCTRSVSVCPPAYYAHLAAFRGRLMVQERDDSASEVSERSAATAPAFHSINNNLIGIQYYV